MLESGPAGGSGQPDKVEQLGQQTIDGRQVVGFRIPWTDRKTTIWADPNTGLPVRVETIWYRSLKGHKLQSRSVMSNFRINVELDESLLSLEVPEGYSVERIKMDASQPTVKDLVQTLRVVAEHNDGTFPARLLGAEGIVGVKIDFLNAKHGKGDSPEKRKARLEFEMKTGRGDGFVRSLAPENDYHYAGRDVKLGTPDRPIFWYKPTGADKHRVIYADLSVKDMTPEEVKELPEATPR